ncbi:aardvark [Anaeramoeba ignava]|uniref:Aardvark n=1 Tax=Anaeramoeba ignava TaxID=1746090 RepID=A0A9Q0LNJ1_ANAIG|nr:aardvark [Anaeramoeba ignava]
MEEPEICPICFQNYSQERKPMIICQDGHSICGDCVKKIDGCPFCRTSFDDFKPILNRTLLQLIQTIQKKPKEQIIPFIPLSELEVEPKPFAIGGTAQIFKAKWKGKDVVIKRINIVTDEKANEQFENELKLAMKIEHPSIIKMYGKTEMDNLIGLVVEFANQGDLTNKILSLTFEEQVDYSLQIIEGIRVLHSNSIIHRDLKPENILVCDNQPKITDFGISKVREHTLKVTSTTVSFGFSAPELFQKENIYDTSCDIFSLSMILYEIFSKKKPFGNENPMMITVKVIQGERPEFSQNFPKELSELIKKGWSSNPKERCTLNKFTQCLERIKPQKPILPISPNNSTPSKPSNNRTNLSPPIAKFVKKTFGIAQYDFEASNPSELSFSFGDEVEILAQHQDGWGDAKFKGKAGLVPLNYLDIIEKTIKMTSPPTPKSRIPPNQIDKSNQFSKPKSPISNLRKRETNQNQFQNQENKLNQIQSKLDINECKKGQQILQKFINEISNLDEKPIEETIKYMKQCSNNQKIQENGCFILQKFANKNEDNRNKLRNLKGIEPIIKAMNNFLNNQDIQIKGCGALQNIAVNNENQIEIRNLKGIEPIIKAMNNFLNNQDIQIKGCGALQNIAANNGNLKGIEPIIKAMNNFLNNQDIQIKGCGALQNIAVNNENQIEIRNLKGIEPIIKAMNNFLNNQNIQIKGCGALQNIAVNNENQIEIRNLKGIEPIIKAMNNFLNNQNIQIKGCGALQNIAANKENKIEIRNLKGIEPIIKAMNNFLNNQDIQYWGCGALQNIAVNKENQIEIRNLNGIESIIKAMNNFPNNQKIQEKGKLIIKRFQKN